MNWMMQAIRHLGSAVRGDAFWETYIEDVMPYSPSLYSIHLAIFVEPYLQFILDGKKTVESRFSVTRRAPYNQVDKGDVILLKKSGGPITGIGKISMTWSYELDPSSWENIRSEFKQALCAEDPSFWKEREKASYATLMRLSHVRSIEPFEIKKQDRRGWVVLKKPLDLFPLT